MTEPTLPSYVSCSVRFPDLDTPIDKVALCGIPLDEWRSFGEVVPAKAVRTLSVLTSALPLTVSRDDIAAVLREIARESVERAFESVPDSSFSFFVGILEHALAQEGGVAYFSIEPGEAPDSFWYVGPGVDLRKDMVALRAIAGRGKSRRRKRPWWQFWR